MRGNSGYGIVIGLLQPLSLLLTSRLLHFKRCKRRGGGGGRVRSLNREGNQYPRRPEKTTEDDRGDNKSLLPCHGIVIVEKPRIDLHNLCHTDF